MRKFRENIFRMFGVVSVAIFLTFTAAAQQVQRADYDVSDYKMDVTLSPKGGTAETIQMLASGNIVSGAATWGAGLFNSINSGATVTRVATAPTKKTRAPARTRPSPGAAEFAWVLSRTGPG